MQELLFFLRMATLKQKKQLLRYMKLLKNQAKIILVTDRLSPAA